jgi:hypothetical protein
VPGSDVPLASTSSVLVTHAHTQLLQFRDIARMDANCSEARRMRLAEKLDQQHA